MHCHNFYGLQILVYDRYSVCIYNTISFFYLIVCPKLYFFTTLWLLFMKVHIPIKQYYYIVSFRYFHVCCNAKSLYVFLYFLKPDKLDWAFQKRNFGIFFILLSKIPIETCCMYKYLVTPKNDVRTFCIDFYKLIYKIIY